MIRRTALFMVIICGWLSFAVRCPAPLIYTPGEGWRYEKPGGEGSWTRQRAKDQLEVAQQAFDRRDYGVAAKAARRTVNVWPFSDYAPQGQYLYGRCEEARFRDESAFKAYQKLIERYPKVTNYNEIVLRQMAIANRFLAGQWFKLFNYVPYGPSMDKTIKFYEQIIKNGPYSEVAPQAQINIGVANEQKFVKDYPEAARSYEKAADRYAGTKEGTDALFMVGDTHFKESKRADYDQSVAGQAIANFTDFSTLYPDDKRVPEARKKIGLLKAEQARGAYEIARYYERRGKWNGALIYYNEARNLDSDSKYGEEAMRRIDEIKKKHGQ